MNTTAWVALAKDERYIGYEGAKALAIEVERLTADNASLRDQIEHPAAVVLELRGEITRLTALCDGYRGEVAELKVVEARVEHIKRSYAGGENWLRCLERAEKAESALTRARAEAFKEIESILEYHGLTDAAAAVRARANERDSAEACRLAEQAGKGE